FALGMLLPTLGRAAAARLSPTAALIAAACGALAIVLPHALLGMYSPWSALVEGCGAAVLVGVVAYRADLRMLRALDARALRLVGRVSGSYYVLHPVVASLAAALTTLVVPAAWFVAVPGALAIAVIAAWLAAMVPIALLGFRFVETLGIAL